MSLYPLLLLCTGICISLLAQKIIHLSFFRYESHVIPWVKFVSMLVFSLLGKAQKRSSEQSKGKAYARGQKALMLLIGALDTVAYVSFCVGFSYCGAGTSAIILSASSQTCTAFATLFILKKRLSKRRYLAVLLVLIGIAIKAYESGEIESEMESRNQMIGILYTSLAGILYSSLGIAYELLLSTATDDNPAPGHADIMFNSSLFGTVSSSMYGLLYVAPRWQSLVKGPLDSSSISGVFAILLLAFFGAAYNAHMYGQSLVFRSDGALGVGLVNAVRGSLINLSAGLVFCPSNAPNWQDCVSTISMVSGMMTTFGGILWVLGADATKIEKREKQE